MDSKEKKKANIVVNKYNKHLDNTVIILTFLSFLLVGILAFFWGYYIPKKKNTGIKLEYEDNRDPSNIEKSTNTTAGLNALDISGGNNANLNSLNNKENILKSGLKQFCTTDSEDGSGRKTCQDGLICTPNILVDGPICLTQIGGECNSLNDCVPEADICLDRVCSVVDSDKKINTSCQNDSDCQLNIFEDQINNHFCLKNPGEKTGICKINLFPFDGGCTLDSQCPSLEGKIIRCIKDNTFSDTLMSATLKCSSGDTCQNGKDLTLILDQKFNLNYLIDNSQTYMLYISLQNISLQDIENHYPFTISDVDNTNNIISLSPLEFYQGYTSFNNNTGVSVYFGDFPGSASIKDNGKYGICIELLPAGSPSNYKIGNVTIPPTDIVPTKKVENIYVKGN